MPEAANHNWFIPFTKATDHHICLVASLQCTISQAWRSIDVVKYVDIDFLYLMLQVCLAKK